MAKKSSGFLPLLAGIAAGAAAVFFSKKENRVLARKEIKAARTAAVKLKKELKANPKATVKRLEKKGERLIKKTVKQATKKTPAKAKVAAGKTTKRRK